MNAIVTRGGGDIGGAGARLLAASGADVVVVDADLAAAERVAQEINQGLRTRSHRRGRGCLQVGRGPARCGHGGCPRSNRCRRACRRNRRPRGSTARSQRGRLRPRDGRERPRRFPWDQIRATANVRRRRDRQRREPAVSPLSVVAAYAAYTHGAIGLTRTAALEGAAPGIRVNAVCPGPIEARLMSAAGGGASHPPDHDPFLRGVPLPDTEAPTRSPR